MGYPNDQLHMTELILRYTGEGATPVDDLQRVRSLSGCRIIEESGRMVLLESAKLNADELARLFPGWVATPLRRDIKTPDPRPRPKRLPPRQA